MNATSAEALETIAPMQRTFLGWPFSHTIHVWYIYLHEWSIFVVHVGRYAIHGWYGFPNGPKNTQTSCLRHVYHSRGQPRETKDDVFAGHR